MTLSLQVISDRLEIQDLLYEYADCIDRRNFDGLRNVFSDDAHIDYSAFGGSVGNVDETLSFLKEALPLFKNYQHLNSNIQIKLDGDKATGRIMCFNPQEMITGDKDKPATHIFMLGLWYVDEYRRTPQGWRINKRAEEKSWVFNLPDFMSFDD